MTLSCLAPAVSTQPISQQTLNAYPTATAPAMLSVSMSGTGPFTYQWYREGTNGAAEQLTNGADFSGVTSATLRILKQTKAAKYFVRVKNDCGGEVESAKAEVKVPPLELRGLEVTQGLQDLGDTVKLLEGRSTTVRAHVKPPAGSNLTVKDVTAKLTAPSLDQSTGPLTVSSSVTFSRKNYADSFNFDLPQGYGRGAVEMEFRVGDDYDLKCSGPGLTQTEHNGCKTQVTFEPPQYMTVVLVGVDWTGKDGRTPHQTKPGDFAQVEAEIEATFPVSKVAFARTSTRFRRSDPDPVSPLPESALLGPPDGERDLREITSQLRGICGYFSTPYCVGIIPDLAGANAESQTGTISLLGVTYRNGITRTADIALGYVVPFNVAHELGHAAGRSHSNFNQQNGHNNPEGCGLSGLPGSIIFPCTTDPPDGTISPSHVPYDASAVFGLASSNLLSQAVFGPQSSRTVVEPTIPDLMSYGYSNIGRTWPARATYHGILATLRSRFGAGGPVSPEEDRPAGEEVSPLVGENALSVSGTVSLVQEAGGFSLVRPVISTAPSPAATGTYSVRLENAQGQEIARRDFEPDVPSEATVTTGTFNLLLPLQTGTSRVVLLHNGQELAARRVSANAPTVRVISPNGGESLSGESATLRWAASDPDGDRLTYDIEYSKDSGVTWQTLAASWPDTTYELRLDLLGGTSRALVRVTANDGYNSSQDQSDAAFSIARHAPRVSVKTPANGRLYVGDEMIVLSGGGYDAEDGQLSDAAFTWVSSLSGTLGAGSSVSIKASALSEGTHTVTLTAKDSDNQTGTAAVTIQVYRTPPALPAALSVTPASLRLIAQLGSAQTQAQEVDVRNAGDGTLSWTAMADKGWVKLSATSGTAPSTLSVTTDPAGLAEGQYTGQITVTSAGSQNSPQVVQVALTVTAPADVSLTKTASAASVAVGSQVTYTLTATNNGPGAATSLVVTDTLPPSLSFVSCSSTQGGVCGGSGNARTVSFASLAANASATVTLVAAVNGSVAAGTQIMNTATAASTKTDPSPGNNTASAAVRASAATPAVQFSQATYQFPEGAGSASLTVTRTGDTSAASTVSFRTVDATDLVPCDPTLRQADGSLFPQGKAFARCDYATVVTTVSFAPGETAKQVLVPLIDDAHVEGNETFQVALSNPAAGTTLGPQSSATVTILDDDAAGKASPLSQTSFFVRQHYLDFLSREPEAGEPWSAVLNTCAAGDTRCDRIQVSASFFGSAEFQLKGAYVFRFYRLAFNRLPQYDEIVPDMSFIAGQTAEEVFARRAELSTLFTQRAEFAAAYGALSNDAYVSALMNRYSLQQVTTPDPQNPDGSAKVTLTRADLGTRLTSGALTRAQVFRAVADSDEVSSAERNRAFVAMQYYGYLRRTPEEPGFTNWLNTLNAGDIRAMVNGFLNSTEYRRRFGQP